MSDPIILNHHRIDDVVVAWMPDSEPGKPGCRDLLGRQLACLNAKAVVAATAGKTTELFSKIADEAALNYRYRSGSADPRVQHRAVERFLANCPGLDDEPLIAELKVLLGHLSRKVTPCTCSNSTSPAMRESGGAVRAPLR